MQMLKGRERNDPALRTTTAAGLFRIRWNTVRKACLSSAEGEQKSSVVSFCMRICKEKRKTDMQ